MDRRQFIVGSAAAGAALSAGETFAQEAFPTRNVTIINAFPPGGANDLITRPMAAALEAVFKQPVVVETKAGAAGAVGAQVAASAKPDGYSILSHNNGLASYAEVDRLFGRQPKFTSADFIPLGRLSADPVLLLVNAQQPYKTLEEFLDAAKKTPEKIVYSSGGLYGASHLPMAMLEHAAKLPRLRHLPTNGGGPAVTALLGNNAQASTQSVQAAIQHIKAGKLRALASFGAERSKSLPDVPTLKERGIDIVYYLWVGLFAPKAVPPAIVTTLAGAVEKAGNSAMFKDAITKIGLEPGFQPQQQFAKFWAEDSKRSNEAVIQIGKVQG
jgi:tripartite-type tricarboxylate transporter receptor subunit TctC